jgi:hypothetical protein
VPPRVLVEPTQTSSPSPWARRYGPVDALGGDDVGVVDLDQLLGGERLGRPEDHVPGVMHDDVDAVGVGEDPGDACVHRLLVADVELDGPLRVGGGVVDGGLVASSGVADAGVDEMTGVGQGPDGHGAESARGAGNEDGLGHDELPFRDSGWCDRLVVGPRV